MKPFTVIMVLSLVLALSGMCWAVPPGKKIEFAGGKQGKVIFDGKKHADAGFTCEVCHLESPTLFQMQKGADQISMKDMHNDRYCGSCHNGTKAFNNDECDKCHIKPNRR